MSISLVSVTVTGPAELRVEFSEAPVNHAKYDPSCYAIATRYGVDVPCYAKTAEVYSSTVMTITLRDAMLTGGHYGLAVTGIEGADGVAIEDGPGPHALTFEGVGDPLTVFDIKRRVPPWWNTRRGSRFYGLLYAIGYTLDLIMGKGGLIAQIKAGLSVRTATGEQLVIIGQNLGVDRPSYLIGNDDLYRQLIPVFATRPKSKLQAFVEALTILLGDAATYHWGVYEIRPNEIVINLPVDLYLSLVPGTEQSATYLHDSDTGTSTAVGSGSLTDSAKDWTTNLWASSILIDSATAAFNIVSNTAHVLTLTSGTPAAGHYVILQSSATLYPGDYFVADYLTPGTAVGSNPVQLFGQSALTDTLEKIKAAGMVIVISPV